MGPQENCAAAEERRDDSARISRYKGTSAGEIRKQTTVALDERANGKDKFSAKQTRVGGTKDIKLIEAARNIANGREQTAESTRARPQRRRRCAVQSDGLAPATACSAGPAVRKTGANANREHAFETAG